MSTIAGTYVMILPDPPVVEQLLSGDARPANDHRIYDMVLKEDSTFEQTIHNGDEKLSSYAGRWIISNDSVFLYKIVDVPNSNSSMSLPVGSEIAETGIFLIESEDEMKIVQFVGPVEGGHLLHR